MRVIKLGVISVVVLFLLITGMSLLLPSQVIISRAIDISKPMDSVFNTVADLSKWHSWMDNYDSTNTTVSQVSKGKDARIEMGKVKVTVTQLTANSMKATWQSGDSRPLDGSFNFIPASNGQIVTVQWQFVQNVKWYPWEKFASITSDKIIGPYMETSLDNLKRLLENR